MPGPVPEAPEAATPTYGPPESYRTRALLALVVALIGVVAFVIGIRRAVRSIPVDAEAQAEVRRDSLLRLRSGGATTRPGVRGGGVQPDELPRLR